MTKRKTLQEEEIIRTPVFETDVSSKTQSEFSEEDAAGIETEAADSDEEEAEAFGSREGSGTRRVLTKEQEEALGRRIRNGDKEAEQELVLANLGLSASIAKRFVGRGVDLEELVQEGYMGLMKAASKFNPDLGYRFSTYAVHWVRQAVSKYVAENGRLIKLPTRTAEKLAKIKATEAALENETGEKPSNAELSAATGIPEEEIKRILGAATDTLSLDYSAGGDSDSETEMGAFIQDESFGSPEEAVEEEALREVLSALMKNLSEKEREVLELRFGLNGNEPTSLSEIGRRYGHTREWIRQIENSALKKLSSPKNKAILADFR